MELTSHHQPEEFGKGQEQTGDASPYVLSESFSLESILTVQCMCHWEGPWVTVTGQRQSICESCHHKTQDCKPRGRAVLPGPLTLPFSTQEALRNKVSCFVSVYVSSDNSFLNVTQEPPFGPPLPATSVSNACPSGQSFCLFYWGTVDTQVYNSGSQFFFFTVSCNSGLFYCDIWRQKKWIST